MSQAPDVTKLSDQELMALINSGGSIPAGTPQGAAPSTVAAPIPVNTAPLAPPQGTNEYGQFLDGTAAPTAGDKATEVVNRGVVSAADGVPVLGAYGDEADAATAAGIAPTLEPIMRHMPHLVQAIVGYDPRKEIGDLPTFGQRYEAARNLQRYDADQFHADHPALDTGLKVAGGIGGTIAMLPALGAATTIAGPEAGLLARAATGAVEGAGVGAADSYGRGEGSWSDPSRVRGAETGAAFGAAAGAALPIVTQVGKVAYKSSIGHIVDAVRGKRVVQAPMTDEAERLASALRGDATAPDPSTSPGPSTAAPSPDRLSTEAALISANRAPLTVNASNVDDAYIRIARAVRRQEMTPEEAATKTQELGPLGVLADTGESTRDLLRAAMNRPGPGGTIAAENLTPRQAGIFDPESGKYLARPSSIRITDQAQSGMGLSGKDYQSELNDLLAQRKAAAGPAYTKAYSAQPVATTELSDFAGAPDFTKAYGRARAISQKEFVTQPDRTEKIVPLPEKMPAQLDWRTLDLMKQGLDDTISEAKREGIGANSQGASKGYLKRFVAKLDSINPDYAAARDAFSGPTAMKDALEEGRGLLSEDAPTVAANISARPEGEKQMLRLGALQALQTKLGNANVTFDAANQAGFLKPNQLARFKALFPDQKSFADFYKTMQNEKSMFATNAAAFGNSSTVKQALNVAEGSDPVLEGVGQMAAKAPEGDIFGIIKAIHRLGQESPMSENTAATIASILSRHHGDDMAQVVSRMKGADRAAALADVLRKSNGAMAGEATARTVQRDQ